MRSASSPHVSVIIPAFRSAATLREAVESCLAQTRGSLEVLVVEDGSDDGTFDIAKECEASDRTRVRVLQHPGATNRGVATSRNLGLDAARGETIAFLDADDAWLPHKLQVQLDVLSERPEVGFVFSDVLNAVDPDPAQPMSAQAPVPDPFRSDMAQRFNASPDSALATLCLHPTPYRYIPSPTPLIRRQLLEGGLRFIGKPELCLQYEDFLMWRILAARTRFHCMQDPLAIYRVHGGSFTGSFASKGTRALHLLALEQVQEIFVRECGAEIPESLVAGMRVQQGVRIIEGVHRLRWRDLMGMLRIATRYGVGGALIKRRMQASLVGMRSAVGVTKRKITQGVRR